MLLYLQERLCHFSTVALSNLSTGKYNKYRTSIYIITIKKEQNDNPSSNVMSIDINYEYPQGSRNKLPIATGLPRAPMIFRMVIMFKSFLNISTRDMDLLSD